MGAPLRLVTSGLTVLGESDRASKRRASASPLDKPALGELLGADRKVMFDDGACLRTIVSLLTGPPDPNDRVVGGTLGLGDGRPISADGARKLVFSRIRGAAPLSIGTPPPEGGVALGRELKEGALLMGLDALGALLDPPDGGIRT